MTASLEKENAVKAALEQKFPGKVSDVRIDRARRMFAKTSGADVLEVLAFLKNEHGFDHLSTVTGLEEGDNLVAMYHVVSGGVLMSLRALVPTANPVLQTVTNLFPGAEDFDRELVDMFGIKVEGLKPGNRYPLPDDWPVDQHPLRKNWKGLMPAAEEGK